MHPVIERFGKSVVIVDGGMGTLLQANGLMGGELPELWNLTHPEVLLKIQSDYVNAGCDILTANMFGANRLKLEKTGHTVQEVVSQALKLAHTASGGKAAVALDIGPSGKLLKPFGDLAFDDAYELFKEEIIAGRDNADLVIYRDALRHLRAELTADYGDYVVPFALDCETEVNGPTHFTVAAPETLAGITAAVDETGGTVTYDGLMMDFGLLANGRLAPAAGPAVVAYCWSSAYLAAGGEEDGRFRATYEKDYEEKMLKVDTWFENGIPIYAEVCYNGQRILNLTISEFSLK